MGSDDALRGGAVRLTLPLPAKELSPNARVHWAVKARAAKHARDVGMWSAIQSLCGFVPPRWTGAELRAEFYFKTNRVRDRDNHAAMLKPYLDGFADAGLVVNDSAFVPLPPEMCCDKLNPRVEIEIRPTASNQTL